LVVAVVEVETSTAVEVERVVWSGSRHIRSLQAQSRFQLGMVAQDRDLIRQREEDRMAAIPHSDRSLASVVAVAVVTVGIISPIEPKVSMVVLVVEMASTVIS
jgi:hypothetical protein